MSMASAKQTTQPPASYGEYSIQNRPLTRQEYDQMAKRSKLIMVPPLVLGSITMIIGMANYMFTGLVTCIMALVFVLITIGVSAASAKQRGKLHTAIREGMVSEITGNYYAKSPVRGFSAVGPVFVFEALQQIATVQEGQRVTIGCVPGAETAFSLNGIPLKYPLQMKITEDVLREVRARGISTPAPVAPSAPAAVAVAAPPIPEAAPVPKPVLKFCPYHGCRTDEVDGVQTCPECKGPVEEPPRYCKYHGCPLLDRDGILQCMECDE
jgi:hypothetical protein